MEEGVVLGELVSRDEAYGIDYNVIEAFDQPWKTNEGGVGMYWGVFDASRHAKFAWTGLVSDPDHWKIGALAVLLGLLVSRPRLARRAATFVEAAGPPAPPHPRHPPPPPLFPCCPTHLL